ncbi:MAG: cytochrome P450 [Chloroflexota bacterium]
MHEKHAVEPRTPAGSFEDLPVVYPPEDFARRMPVYLAQAADDHGPIFALEWAPGHRVVCLIGPEANKFVLHTHREHFSHDKGWTPILGEYFGHGLLNMDGDEHASHRKMMNPAFTVAYMARYLPIMDRVIERRAADWAARGVVDLYDETRKITFDIAAEALAGMRTGAEVDRLRDLFFTLLYPDLDPAPRTEEEWLALMLPVHQDLRAVLLNLIARRRREARSGAAPSDGHADLLTTMVHLRDEEGRGLDDEQILAHVNILLVAGHETSTSMAAWLLSLLASHPDYLRRVHAELETALGPSRPVTLESLRGLRVLANALSETGRLYSPVGMAPRGVVREFTFGGYTVPAGTQVRYAIAAGHRLPQIFAEPQRFDPDRFAPPREEDKRHPYALIPFGGGSRICIGINFAQVEIKALAAHVLRRYTFAPVEGHHAEQLYYGVTGFLPTGLPMHVTPRG